MERSVEQGGKGRKFRTYPKGCRARARKKERERGVSGEPLILLIMHLRSKENRERAKPCSAREGNASDVVGIHIVAEMLV